MGGADRNADFVSVGVFTRSRLLSEARQLLQTSTHSSLTLDLLKVIPNYRRKILTIYINCVHTDLSLMAITSIITEKRERIGLNHGTMD